MSTQQPWNINIHYNALVDAQVPPGAQEVLDVGCGDGFLAARLAERIPRVVALDIDEPVLQRAAARFPEAPVQWTHGDVMTVELPDFDAVVSNAALHHIDDTRAALARLARLLRVPDLRRSGAALAASADATRTELMRQSVRSRQRRYVQALP